MLVLTGVVVTKVGANVCTDAGVGVEVGVAAGVVTIVEEFVDSTLVSDWIVCSTNG